LDTSKAVNMDNMFAFCVNLTEKPQIDTSNISSVRSMTNMFYGCLKLNKSA